MAVKPNIVVCGDSFCTAMKNSREHFSQVLEDRFGYTVVNLARSSMSTAGICFQIQAAIQLQPDVIVYAETGPARLNIPMTNKFHASAGLKNFIYHVPNEAAYGHDMVGDASAAIFSQNISTLADMSDHSIHAFLESPIDPEVRQAVKMYVAYIYHEELQHVIESWMYAHWHKEIESHGILPIKFSRNTFAAVAYEFSLANPRWPRAYHTDDATQVILAERIHDIVQKSH